uniref:Uncharacterized protein n=1 Tax=Sphaerodactylus townsendi TaxID=933632 RepID=A0ACB8F708_9SAUR
MGASMQSCASVGGRTKKPHTPPCEGTVVTRVSSRAAHMEVCEWPGLRQAHVPRLPPLSFGRAERAYDPLVLLAFKQLMHKQGKCLYQCTPQLSLWSGTATACLKEPWEM